MRFLFLYGLIFFVHSKYSRSKRIYSGWGYRTFFENGLLRVIQPDLSTCCGLTKCKKICYMAHVYDIRVQMHICSGSITAALQKEAVIPNFIIHETHRFSLLEGHISTCKYDSSPRIE